VPVLADLGSTVAPGALLALLFSALLAFRPESSDAQQPVALAQPAPEASP
jgi:predicted exporter